MPSVLPTKFNRGLVTDDTQRRFGFRRPSFSSDRPSGPAEGDAFYELDTNILYVWNGTAWDPINPPIFTEVQAAGAGATSSVTYVDFPGPVDLAFTKRASHTLMLATGAVSLFKGINAGLVHIALLINGVDYDLNQFFFNTINEHNQIAFSRHVANGLAAGNYTARLRWRTLTSSVNADSNDSIIYSLQELRG